MGVLPIFSAPWTTRPSRGKSPGYHAIYEYQYFPRSKKETERLHRLHKPVREARVDDLPSVHSHDEEECSDIGSLDASLSSDSTTDSDEPVAQNQYQGFNEFDSESDAEMAYERIPRKRGPSMETRHIPGLPIKLSDGRIQATNKVITTPLHPDTEDDESEVDKPSWHDATPVKDVTTGARFGRLAIMDVISIKPRTARVQGAKEQIASICQEILANPENSVCWPNPVSLSGILRFSSVRSSPSSAHLFPRENHVAI